MTTPDEIERSQTVHEDPAFVGPLGEMSQSSANKEVGAALSAEEMASARALLSLTKSARLPGSHDLEDRVLMGLTPEARPEAASRRLSTRAERLRQQVGPSRSRVFLARSMAIYLGVAAALVAFMLIKGTEVFQSPPEAPQAAIKLLPAK